MLKTKLIYGPVSGPAQLEQLINNTLENLQKSGYKVTDVKFSNSQALIIYDETVKKKSSKILNETV